MNEQKLRQLYSVATWRVCVTILSGERLRKYQGQHWSDSTRKVHEGNATMERKLVCPTLSGWREEMVSNFFIFLSCFSVLSKHSVTWYRRCGGRDGTENQYSPEWLSCNLLV